MIISNKLIRKGRVHHRCGRCGERIKGPKIRTYGAADRFETPYAMYFHVTAYPAITRKLLR